MALIDFSDPKELACWSAIDDAVTGGRSRSRMHFDAAGHAVFSRNRLLGKQRRLRVGAQSSRGNSGTARAPYRKSCRSAPLSAKRHVTDTQLTATSWFPKYGKGRRLDSEFACVGGSKAFCSCHSNQELPCGRLWVGWRGITEPIVRRHLPDAQ
ncbi:MAG: CIA30 family protein [Comamonadaceae bacterium]|nr:CIA30 family protein [Comamonadaceae bacterium]